ncbi:MAG TPA: DUF4136 domain-containing protein [Bryobacteraceae bacterium]|nr:DUF4136 domain-containing protein [Bryobacteraceae bacterium]
MKFRLSRLLLPALIAACVAFAADITTDYNHHADFSRYHTYSWIGVRAGNSLWQDRIMNAVDSALAAKGWTKVPSGGEADVSAFGKTREQDTLETFYDGFPGWGWRGWGGGMGMATTEAVPERVGSLTVDIFDGGTKQLVWRGTAEHTLSSKPEENDKKLDHAVDDMFKHFPPESKG